MSQKKKTRQIAVVDCETDPFKRYRIPRPFIWGFFDGETFEVFYETMELIRRLRDYNGIVYAHNGGKFDWHFILPQVDAYQEILLINGRIAKMRLGSAELRDSYNIIPVSMKEYVKDEFDYTLMEEENRVISKNKKLIEQYLASDCRNQYDLVMRFIDQYGMNLTLAGAALKQWRKISEAEIPVTDARFYEEIHPYYYGGRVQCFEEGIIHAKFNVYDIKSAYPEAMLYKHPYSRNYAKCAGFKRGADFYRVRCISRGAFPYRGLECFGKRQMGLYFPSDSEIREYTITKWEYEAARETKTIEEVEVIESLSFMNHVSFEEYVKHFYTLKIEAEKNGDKALRLFSKLFMNSLYGKFAANPENYKNYMIVPMDVIAGLPGVGWEFAGEFGPWGLAQSDLEEEEMRFYNVATGASITGFVRAKLWKAMFGCQRVLYCDTDSIACVKKSEDMHLGDELGMWENEGSFIKAGISGKKLYVFESDRKDEKGRIIYKTASKGVRLLVDELYQVAEGKMVEYVPETPTFSPKKNVFEIEIDKAFVKREVRKTVKII